VFTPRTAPAVSPALSLVRWASRRTILVAAVVLAAAGLGAGTASAVPAPATPCAAVHVLASRAATKAPGSGVIGSLVTLVQNSIASTVSTSSVNYPALLFPYNTSTGQGDAASKQELTARVQQCPDQTIVLVGYSQGARLVGDVLRDGGGVPGPGAANAPGGAATAAHVVAVVWMGDPRHLPNLSLHRGTAVSTTGLFPRPASQPPRPFANIIASYCDTGDPFCAGGANLAAHLDHTTRYDAAANSFVVNRLRAAGVN
jgi:acetylxylan esterase